jgi:hypothetical protein
MNATLAAHAFFSGTTEERPLSIDRPARKPVAMSKTRTIPTARPGLRGGDHHLRDVVREMRAFSSWRPRW